jgi:hypothetical protein
MSLNHHQLLGRAPRLATLFCVAASGAKLRRPTIPPLPRCEGFGQEHFNISNDVGNKNPPANSQSGFENHRRFSWIYYTPAS